VCDSRFDSRFFSHHWNPAISDFHSVILNRRWRIGKRGASRPRKPTRVCSRSGGNAFLLPPRSLPFPSMPSPVLVATQFPSTSQIEFPRSLPWKFPHLITLNVNGSSHQIRYVQTTHIFLHGTGTGAIFKHTVRHGPEDRPTVYRTVSGLSKLATRKQHCQVSWSLHIASSRPSTSSSSSSSSRNEYDLGGIIALLLQDHRTMSTKSVCSSQYMVTDQHWATGVQIKHSTLSDRIRERRPEQNGLQFSAEDGKRRRVPNVLR